METGAIVERALGWGKGARTKKTHGVRGVARVRLCGMQDLVTDDVKFFWEKRSFFHRQQNVQPNEDPQNCP